MATLKILSSPSLIPWGIATVNAIPDATFLFIQDQALWSQDGKCRTRPEAMAVHFFYSLRDQQHCVLLKHQRRSVSSM